VRDRQIKRIRQSSLWLLLISPSIYSFPLSSPSHLIISSNQGPTQLPHTDVDVEPNSSLRERENERINLEAAACDKWKQQIKCSHTHTHTNSLKHTLSLLTHIQCPYIVSIYTVLISSSLWDSKTLRIQFEQ